MLNAARFRSKVTRVQQQARQAAHVACVLASSRRRETDGATASANKEVRKAQEQAKR